MKSLHRILRRDRKVEVSLPDLAEVMLNEGVEVKAIMRIFTAIGFSRDDIEKALSSVIIVGEDLGQGFPGIAGEEDRLTLGRGIISMRSISELDVKLKEIMSSVIRLREQLEELKRGMGAEFQR